ncbi:hypothetical protein [Xanthomonas albilineans]|uniref:hypothetical protein n=1 Tax=Xanthomonas albilineans TaxID=29447 RepID=UPI000A76DBE9|nr:hypothetical protein [Xanthomonas albilineans]
MNIKKDTLETLLEAARKPLRQEPLFFLVTDYDDLEHSELFFFFTQHQAEHLMLSLNEECEECYGNRPYDVVPLYAAPPAHAAVPIDEELAGYLELLDRQNHSLRRVLAWYCEANSHVFSADGDKSSPLQSPAQEVR